MTTLKARTTRALAGMALPECFAQATVAAEAVLLARKPSERTVANRRDLKRLASKARKLEVRS